MLLMSLVRFIALFYQQQLTQYIEPEQSIEPYLAHLELQHEIAADYYQVCGRW